MNAPDYLERLKASLKGFPPAEQAALLEEIAGHIEAAQMDAGFGSNPSGPDAPGQRLAAEMGSPEELGRGLREVHRPNRWIDFLLVTIPLFLVLPLVSDILQLLFPQVNAVNFAAPALYIGIRVTIVLQAGLLAFSLLRHSKTLLAFWLPETILIVFVLCYREKRWEWVTGYFNSSLGGVIESIFWLALLAGLIIWLVDFLLRSREPLLRVLALLPFLFTAGNMAAGSLITTGGFPDGYNMPQWILFGYIGVQQIGRVLWPVFFYLPRQRPLRWLGLLVYALPLALMNLLASTRYPVLAMLWSTPVLLVVGAWVFERKFSVISRQKGVHSL
jgi:hypothetical protein